MKILLINPGQFLPLKINYPLNAFQPLGLGYLAKQLLKNKYQVEIFDVLAEGYDQETVQGQFRYVGLPNKEIRDKIRKFAPTVVGITAPFTAQAKAAHEMAKLVKTVNPKIKVVLGGSYPTTHTERILDDKNVDFVIRGEGEVGFLELVKKIDVGMKNFSHIKGLAFRKNGKIKLNLPRPPIQNLDDYQVAWELLPMEKYFEAAYQVKSSRSISTFGKRWATLFTSRGCPYHCTFCVGYQVMGRVWRPRSPENVVAEMDYLIKRFKIQHFDIEDDNFTLDKERAKKICEKIIEKNWQIGWSLPNGVRADTMDEDLVRKMKAAGCRRLIVAPESGDQRVVNQLMKKNINLKKVNQVVNWCRKYGITVDAFFLLGMPGEKEKNLLKTIQYAKKLRKLGVNECGFGMVVPHKGTEIYDLATKKGWLRSDFKNKSLVEGLMMGEPMLETPYLSAQKLKQFLKQAYKVNPLIPFTKFKLAVLLMLKSPQRFLKLSFSYFLKQRGLARGLLGTE